jgi:hypothetical protein
LFSIAVLGMWAAGYSPLPGEPRVLLWCLYAAALMAGHVAALAYSVTVGALLSFLFRRRIAREKGCQRGQFPAH